MSVACARTLAASFQDLSLCISRSVPASSSKIKAYNCVDLNTSAGHADGQSALAQTSNRRRQLYTYGVGFARPTEAIASPCSRPTIRGDLPDKSLAPGRPCHRIIVSEALSRAEFTAWEILTP